MEHRQGSKAYTVRMKKRSMVATIVVILLSIVLIAGIVTLSPLGDYLIEHVFRPVVSLIGSDRNDKIVSALKNQEQQPSESPTAAPTPEPVHNSLNIVETPFYLLQMGAYTEQDAAEAHAQQIRAMGAGGMVYPDGSVFRVFAAAYRDEQSLQSVQKQVRSDGFEATPYITDQNSVYLTLKGDPAAVKMTEDAVLLLTETPNLLCDLSLNFDKGTVSGDDLKETLQDLLAKIQDRIDSFRTTDTASLEPILTLLQKYQNRISTFLQEHDTIQKTNACDLKRLQIECIIDYIQLFERK